MLLKLGRATATGQRDLGICQCIGATSIVLLHHLAHQLLHLGLALRGQQEVEGAHPLQLVEGEGFDVLLRDVLGDGCKLKHGCVQVL